MKIITATLILAPLAFVFVLGKEENKVDFDKELIKLSVLEYQRGSRLFQNDGITAVLNDFIDKLFPNIQKFAIKHKLDPHALDNITEKILIEEFILTNGAIHGISTLDRYKDVEVTYQSSTRTLNIILPIIFSNLSFTYDYEAHLLGLGPEGDMVGIIQNFKFYLDLEFDFKTLTAGIKKLKTTDSGHISVTFHGQLTDIIFNLLSQLVTTILHPLLQGIIEGIVKSTANKIVHNVNDFIYNITHQNFTQYEFQQFAQYYIK